MSLPCEGVVCYLCSWIQTSNNCDLVNGVDICCGRRLLQQQHKTVGEQCVVEEPSTPRDSKSSKRRFEGAKGGGTGTELDVMSGTVNKYCKMPEPLEAAEGVLVPTGVV